MGIRSSDSHRLAEEREGTGCQGQKRNEGSLVMKKYLYTLFNFLWVGVCTTVVAFYVLMSIDHYVFPVHAMIQGHWSWMYLSLSLVTGMFFSAITCKVEFLMSKWEILLWGAIAFCAYKGIELMVVAQTGGVG